MKNYKIFKLSKKIYRFYLIINVYNEGKALHKFLKKIPKKRNYGIVIADSPSDDGSTTKNKLAQFGIKFKSD